MGDRAMAEIRTSEGSLYFYTHWHGAELPEHCDYALAQAQPRIKDEPYALRIVLDSLIHLSGSRDQETGSGIMLTPSAEDEYNHDAPSVLLDIPNNHVTVMRPKRGRFET